MDSPGSEQMTPDQVTAASFGRRFRGADTKAVAEHLRQVADALRALRAENTSLRVESDRLGEELSDRLDSGSALVDLDLDDEALTERVGEEAGRVLRDARTVAADRLSEAETQAGEIRADAEAMYAERSRAADNEVARIRADGVELLARTRSEAEMAGDLIRQQAEADADATRSITSKDKQAADAQAAHVLSEAELTRRQILEDLARRRSSARRQIEQLRAGRERLLVSHEVVRTALDEIKEELSISMSEARAAAETAGFMVSDTTIEELEAEIEAARLTGLLDTGPVPVVEAQPPHDSSASKAIAGAPPSIPDRPESKRPKQAVSKPKPVEKLAAEPEQSAEVPAESTQDRADVADSGLAEVLPLDRGRSDVNTAKHPAAARSDRDAATFDRRSNTDTDTGPDSSADDIFARMRSSRAGEPENDGDDDATAEPSVADPEDALAGELVAVSADLARKLKRVLADEQSDVMSTLSAADAAPSAEELLGTIKDHQARYWIEVDPAVVRAYRVGSGGKGKPGRAVRTEADEMVEGIRRRVEACLDEGGDDLDDIVEALRNLYREVKTQRLNEYADSLCRHAAALGSDR